VTRQVPTPAEVEIVSAGPEDALVAASIIAEAFEILDVTKWLVPDADVRREVVERNMLIWTTHASKYGHIDITRDQVGVAVWFPITEPLPEADDYDARLLEACGPWTKRFKQLDEAFEEHHPHEPHHHLALLAIRPGHQGKGIGTALLNHHHELYPDVADYLEASSPESRELYLRHGFEDRGPFYLPEDGPPLWAMWRPVGG
jgi:GNAT superfamily N-acetyltransferase